MNARYLTADVFTDKRFGGNQLAVFPDASAIAPELMPHIAREFNYSETTFVLPPADRSHTAKVRIFTPGGELQFAGHPTVGTAHVLASIGAIPLTGDETRIVFEEGVGPVPVTIRLKDGKPVSAQLTAAKIPEVGPPAPSAEQLGAMLSLSRGDVLDGDMGPEAVSCGTPFLFVPLRDRAAVGRARLKLDLWEATLGNYLTNKVFVFAMDSDPIPTCARACSRPASAFRRIRQRVARQWRWAGISPCAIRAWTGRCAGSWNRVSRWAVQAFSRWNPTSRGAGSWRAAWAARRCSCAMER
jgi:trans-2,3-dihydro-3-hydroxyanthranilate isomerase